MLHSTDPSKSCFLWFDHMPSYLPPPHNGTFHSLDLTYIFDLSPQYVLKTFYHIDSEAEFTQEDQQLKSTMIDIVADFVSYGSVSLFSEILIVFYNRSY